MEAIKRENENGKAITYKIKFIYNIRFMPSSLSSLAEKLAKEFHKVKCKEYKSDQEYVAVNDLIDIQMHVLHILKK